MLACLFCDECASILSIHLLENIYPSNHLATAISYQVLKLLATATLDASTGRYKLAVGPEYVAQDSFLGGVSEWEMGLVITTDINGVISLKIDEREPVPTAAAVLRDIVLVTA
jgi:homoserine dehydrogenase